MPVGNGRLGAMVFGNVNRERIQLNEETLWMGGPREHRQPRSACSICPRCAACSSPASRSEANALAERNLMGRP